MTEKSIEEIAYEPTYGTYKVVNDLAAFKENADVIITNRVTEYLTDVAEKVFTRDLCHNS